MKFYVHVHDQFLEGGYCACACTSYNILYMQCTCAVCQGPGSDMSRLLVESQIPVRSKSAGGLKVRHSARN